MHCSMRLRVFLGSAMTPSAPDASMLVVVAACALAPGTTWVPVTTGATRVGV
jgi:hypothetical protein